jgi:tyrosinase
MAATRRNILTSATDRDRYIQGITLLKEDDSGLTSDGLQIPRAAGVRNQRLSTYDLFVLWHTRAMEEMTPPGTGRNAAHRGPVFLPWHRFMMILLERNFQRVLNDPNFGLPY